MDDTFNSLKKIATPDGQEASYYALHSLEEQGIGKLGRLPVSIRIVLESVLRNCDGKTITKEHVKTLANWNANNPSKDEIPFMVSRILLQDFTGVPLLVDLAAMRDAVNLLGEDPTLIEPLVPVDLVVDHSVQVDRAGSDDALEENIAKEFERNKERYEFLKWGQQAFKTFNVIPPAVGIVHQVNLEHLANVVIRKEDDNGLVLYPDSLMGTDSHTTMINGLGLVGWGVGGIEAEAGMLGQPIYFQTPEVIGVHITGKLGKGVTATDLTLRITELLRQEKVVGKFVEYLGEGARDLGVADRATIANMAPEYGATMGYFPIDDKTLEYLRNTGRSEEQVTLVESYYKAQGLWGIPLKGEVDYTKIVELNLSNIKPSVAGPKRPQDRIEVPELKEKFLQLFEKPISEGGYGKNTEDLEDKGHLMVTSTSRSTKIRHGSVLIAAITSCTNTSNPSVMIAAGLLAKKAYNLGLTIPNYVKTSLAPGSRVVTEYLRKTDLQKHLDALGFHTVGYGCTTCIGNSGPLHPLIETSSKDEDLIAASVLSGNRNFEARVHPSIKANFLMSPPLVVAYALAGRVDINLDTEPLGKDKEGNPVLLKDIWPSHEEIGTLIAEGLTPEIYSQKYSNIDDANTQWNKIKIAEGALYKWNSRSTYIQKPPFFENFGMELNELRSLENLRPMALFGDSVTTDHISPAGAISSTTPAGEYLTKHGLEPKLYNSFGSRRGNDQVMTRGTFGNVRIKNQLADGKEGGYTKLMPEGKVVSIYEACQEYKSRGESLIVFAGSDYGMGSSRDWAAKGTSLLGIRAVVAKSFERIHRSNLIGMGVLPLQFKNGESYKSLGITGEETISVKGFSLDSKPGTALTLNIKRASGEEFEAEVDLRIDTEIEFTYYKHGGILPFVLRRLVNSKNSATAHTS